MERALSEAGYAVETALNYQQALSILQKLSPAVPIFDVAMPGMSGFELCYVLKDDPRLQNTPVVFVSGHDSAENAKMGNLASGTFFVQKAKGWGSLLSAVGLIRGSKGTAPRYDSAGAGARFPERRAAPRYPLVASIDITDPISGERITAMTSDISVSGCQIKVASSLQPRSLVHLRITWGGQIFETLATIAHVQPQDMGVAFHEAAPDGVVILARSVQQLSAEQRSER